MSEQTNDNFGFWGVAEFMGHLKVAGYITEEKRFGTELMRVDIPADGEGEFVTRYFSGSALYSVTPCSEVIARAFAARNKPRPVSIYELQLPAPRVEFEHPTERKVDLDNPEDE